MPYKKPPTPVAGTVWTLQEVIDYLVDNPNELYKLLTGQGTSTFSANEVIVGHATDAGLDGVELDDGELLVGASTGPPTALAPGTTGQILVSTGGTVAWETVDLSISAARIWLRA